MTQEILVTSETVDRMFGKGSANGLTSKAVEAERERGVTACKQLGDSYVAEHCPGIASGCYRCADVLAGKSEPPPPPPEEPEKPPEEPMTIPTVIEKLKSGRYAGDRHWDDLKADLFVLIEDQARRDAECCLRLVAAASPDNDGWIMGCQVCNEHILKFAGLE